VGPAGDSNLQPAAWRITALFQRGYIIYILLLTVGFTRQPDLHWVFVKAASQQCLNFRNRAGLGGFYELLPLANGHFASLKAL